MGNSYPVTRGRWCDNSFLFRCISDQLNYLYSIQYIPRNMHTVTALLCFVVVFHWLLFPYPSGLLHWHCGNLTIAPVPAKQPWWIWINTLCEFIMNHCITTTKQSTTKSCAYFLGYTVWLDIMPLRIYRLWQWPRTCSSHRNLPQMFPISSWWKRPGVMHPSCWCKWKVQICRYVYFTWFYMIHNNNQAMYV